MTSPDVRWVPTNVDPDRTHLACIAVVTDVNFEFYVYLDTTTQQLWQRREDRTFDSGPAWFLGEIVRPRR